MTQADFFRGQADEMERAARDATLPNVRERYARSAAAWAGMASRAEHSEQLREAEKERKRESGLTS